MDGKLLRILLAVCLAAVLVGLCPEQPARAGGGGSWTNVPPQLDGKATSAEWANRAEVTYSHFRIRYMNDDQFLYVLIDVTDETAASPIAAGENFFMFIDSNSDGTADYEYFLSSTSPNPMFHSHHVGSLWTRATEAASYGEEGFGGSPAASNPHRFYELALRLSEMNVLPGHITAAYFTIASQHPVFTETTTLPSNLFLNPVQVAFVYSSPAGLANATTYHDMLLETAGLLVNYVSLEQAAAADYSPFRAIIIGDDTGTGSPTYNWSGSAAALEKIRASRKPVVGLGLGGIDFFGDLGLFIQHGHTWEGIHGRNIQAWAVEHAAWNTPTSVSTTSPVSLFTTDVYQYAVYTASGGYPWQDITRLGVDGNDGTQTHFNVLAESANDTCYTYWGFRGAPTQLTTDGKNLLANLVWQPACRPSVLFLMGAPIDTMLRDGVLDLLNRNGFPHEETLAANAPTIEPEYYDRLLMGWDTWDEWTSGANVTAVRNSRLPVIGLGQGGAGLFQHLGVPMAIAVAFPMVPQTQANMVNPLQAALRRPYEVYVPAGLRMTVDGSAAGVTMYGAAAGNVNMSETVMGTWTDFAETRSITAQAYKGTCYALYGFQSYPSNMTTEAEKVLLNLLVQPPCSNAIALPMLVK